VTYKKGKELLFPSPPLVVGIKGKRYFTRSSIPKGVFKEQSLPETLCITREGKALKNL